MRPLRRNKGNATPSHLITVTVDTETDAETSTLIPVRVRCVAERRKRNGKWYGYIEKVFLCGAEFWEWVYARTRPREPVTVLGFDWPLLGQLAGLFAELDAERIKLKLPARTTVRAGKPVKVREWHGLAAVGSRPFIVIGVGGRGTIKVVDVRNYVDTEPSKLPTWNGGGEHYAVHGFVKRLIDAWEAGDRGNWGETIGKLAWANYRHEFMHEQIWVDDIRHNREWIRSGYFGGEFQAWYRGIHEGPIYKVDVSSSYPAVMANGLFPRGILEDNPIGSVAGATEPAHPEECLATVLVHCNGETPVRATDESVTWPQELAVTTLCGAELQHAVNEGRVRTWFGWIRFTLSPIFTRFVTYWWALKRQASAVGDDATRLLAKGMLNTLYGRFAMLKPTWSDNWKFRPPVRWGEFIAPHPDGKKFCQWRAVAGNAQLMTRGIEKDDTFPAISAFVTSAQRMYMRQARVLLPERSVLVQQSDSFLLTQRGYDALRETVFWGPDALGCFRLVDTYDYVNVFAANCYQHEPGRTVAGLPAAAEHDGHNRYRWTEARPVGEVVAAGATGVDVPLRAGTMVLRFQGGGRKYGSDGWAWI